MAEAASLRALAEEDFSNSNSSLKAAEFPSRPMATARSESCFSSCLSIGFFMSALTRASKVSQSFRQFLRQFATGLGAVGFAAAAAAALFGDGADNLSGVLSGFD